MKREIKFRGKRFGNGEWVYGWYTVVRNGSGLTGVTVQHMILRGGGLHQTEVDPETVGQFTGLRDKLGTDIYERDVCDHVKYAGIRVISFSKGLFMANIMCENNRWIMSPLAESPSDMLIIVGNIHDNPELLK